MHALTEDLDRVAALLAQHAVELGIDPASVWRPSTHALAAWRTGGGLLRIDISCWSATELTR